MKKNTSHPHKNKLYGGTDPKNKVQTIILGSIDGNILIVFISEKKFPAPLSNRFLEDIFCVPGVAHWKKEVKNVNIELDKENFIIDCYFKKKFPAPS